MKREITIGEALTIVVVLVMSIIGWGVSVEVRLATHKMQIEATLKMEQKVDDMHKLLIRHDVTLEKDSEKAKEPVVIITRGGDVIRKDTGN